MQSFHNYILGLNTKRNSKRSVKDDSSSESEEKGQKKDEEEKKLNLRHIKESESDEGDSSGFVAKYRFAFSLFV